MPAELKNINPDNLGSLEESRQVIKILIAGLEELYSEFGKLKEENRLLREENNRLKGGSARPKFGKRSSGRRDISSGGQEKGVKKDSSDEGLRKEFAVLVDEQITVEVDKSILPPGSVFKGYASYEQQDIEIKRRNKLFRFELWYCPSSGRTFQAPWPPGHVEGHYGPGIRSLLNVLRHMSDVTEPSLHKLMQGLGVKISSGTISNLLKEESEWVLQERDEIFRAALACSGPKQMDATANKQKGKSRMTHIVTAPNFTVFYTTAYKNRLNCLSVLQGNPDEGIKLLWYEGIEERLRAAKVGAQHPVKLRELMENNPCLTLPAFDALMKENAPKIAATKFVMNVVREEMALAYYRTQKDYPPVESLLTDYAHEYEKIAVRQGLCWVHDARRYNLLSPTMYWYVQKLEQFKTRYWEYYWKLLDYQHQVPEIQKKRKPQLLQEFDEVFCPSTDYPDLDKTIAISKANKERLLTVLDIPSMPLHNNAAELAARRVVRKRDISLHTWSDWGTKLRDAFLSVIQTAIKLDVSPFQFICDRVSRKCSMPSLATIIADRNVTPTTF
jgi:hypothetical protein